MENNYDSPTALYVAAVVVAVWRPLMICDGGFWLSFGAVLAIVIILPIFKSLPMQSLLASVSVNLVITPILMYYFYEIPLYGILLNLLVIPLLTVVMIAGLSGSLISLAAPVLGRFVLGICRLIFHIYEVCCRWTLELPKARLITGQPDIWQMIVYYLFLFFVVVLLWHFQKAGDRQKNGRVKRGIILAVGMMIGMFSLVLHPERTGAVSVTVLNVGQGDSIVIRDRKGRAYLVDGGSSDIEKVGEYRIEPYLLSQGIGCLEYVFASHGDEDHINGIREMIERQKVGVEIKNLVLPEESVWDQALEQLAMMGQKEGIPVLIMKKGQRMKMQDMYLTCIHPEKISGIEAGNASSMVLALQYGTFDMLLTGDVEEEGEVCVAEALREQYPNTEWEVLKAAHHGSKNSTKKMFLDVVAPAYTFISAGKDNSYGHPHDETLKRLKVIGSQVYSTQENGALTILVTERRFSVSGFK